MVVLTLDSANQIRGYQATRGTIDRAVVYPREVARFALLDNAGAVALCHNHPSGKTQPSAPDLDLTTRVEQALDTIGIKLIDHLIISDKDTQYFSFAEQELL